MSVGLFFVVLVHGSASRGQVDATLAQLAQRLPGSIQDNAHLIGDGVVVELEDLEMQTIGFLLRAAWEERETGPGWGKKKDVNPISAIQYLESLFPLNVRSR